MTVMARLTSPPRATEDEVDSADAVRHGPTRQARVTSSVVLAAVVGWGLWSWRSELTGVPYLDDSSVHEQMVRFAVRRLQAGHLPLTSWFPYLGLGSPQFLHYQSLPAMLTGTLGLATGGNAAFRITLYLMLSLWPLSVYWSARLFDLGRPVSLLTAAAAPLLIERGGRRVRGQGLRVDWVRRMGPVVGVDDAPLAWPSRGARCRRAAPCSPPRSSWPSPPRCTSRPAIGAHPDRHLPLPHTGRAALSSEARRGCGTGRTGPVCMGGGAGPREQPVGGDQRGPRPHPLVNGYGGPAGVDVARKWAALRRAPGAGDHHPRRRRPRGLPPSLANRELDVRPGGTARHESCAVVRPHHLRLAHGAPSREHRHLHASLHDGGPIGACTWPASVGGPGPCRVARRGQRLATRLGRGGRAGPEDRPGRVVVRRGCRRPDPGLVPDRFLRIVQCPGDRRPARPTGPRGPTSTAWSPTSRPMVGGACTQACPRIGAPRLGWVPSRSSSTSRAATSTRWVTPSARRRS